MDSHTVGQYLERATGEAGKEKENENEKVEEI